MNTSYYTNVFSGHALGIGCEPEKTENNVVSYNQKLSDYNVGQQHFDDVNQIGSKALETYQTTKIEINQMTRDALDAIEQKTQRDLDGLGLS